MTTKYYQVFDTKNPDRIFRNRRTEEEAVALCEKGFGADYMSSYILTYRPVWTNISGRLFEDLFVK